MFKTPIMAQIVDQLSKVAIDKSRDRRLHASTFKSLVEYPIYIDGNQCTMLTLAAFKFGWEPSSLNAKGDGDARVVAVRDALRAALVADGLGELFEKAEPAKSGRKGLSASVFGGINL